MKQTGPSSSFVGYQLNPVGVGFENQEQGEGIILLLRQHLATQILPVVFILILAILPFVATTIIANVAFSFAFLPITKTEVFFAMIVWYLIVFGLAFERFLLWYFNVYLITNERIVDVDFFGIAFKRVSECRLAQIQDVTSATSGPVETFFDYGNVFVQTAAERPEFEFHSVPRPDDVVSEIGVQCRLEEAEEPGEIS